ncbi:MAG: DUF4189 domain-containing protein [Candidatus Accumulibacter sp.]|jgi:hypothetical protein|nr:DUF4189 domain-containing protein [Accumulibacter sp.]
MNKTGYLLLLALSVSSFSLHAQCPPGIPNTPGCIPPDEMNRRGHVVQDPPYSRRRQAPQQYWEGHYGAIAMDKTEPSIGITGADNLLSESQAGESAISACRQKGGKNCQIVFRYANTCGAFVWGVGYGFPEDGKSSQEAAAKAMARCVAQTSNCTVDHQGCCLPVLRRR